MKQNTKNKKKNQKQPNRVVGSGRHRFFGLFNGHPPKILFVVVIFVGGGLGLLFLANTFAATNKSFTVGTYNLLNAESFQGKSNGIGGCSKNSSDPRCIRTRTTRQVKIIRGSLSGKKTDILGTQEVSPKQYREMKKQLNDYGVFPVNDKRMDRNKDGYTAIWWNKNKFKLVESGKTTSLSNLSRKVSVPWVGLKMNNGPKIYVISVHQALASNGGTTNNKKRSADYTLKWMRSKVGPKTPVFIVGDFNENPTRSKLTQCLYNAHGVKNAYDIVRGKGLGKKCVTSNNSSIDHIYYTHNRGVKPIEWTKLSPNGNNLSSTSKRVVKMASDHPYVYSTFRVQ